MVIVLQKNSTREQIQQVCRRLEEASYNVTVSGGIEQTIVTAVGVFNEQVTEQVFEQIRSLPFVETVIRIQHPYKIVSRDWKEEPTLVPLRDKIIGGEPIVVIAGPCSVEGRKQLLETAKGVKDLGADGLRGGAFKPRTTPYAFQGLGYTGLKLLKEVSEVTGLPVVTEVMEPRDVGIVAEVADVLQIGSRNMQNFPLLKEVGLVNKPVLLKRGMSATIEEWLLAAEHICVKGNLHVILCERGVRTFEPYTRNTLDLSAVIAVKKLSHLPVIVDPSHATGRWEMVIPMALAAIAAGADGLLVEVHPNPSHALSDGPQALTLEQFGELMNKLPSIASAVGRKVYQIPLKSMVSFGGNIL